MDVLETVVAAGVTAILSGYVVRRISKANLLRPLLVAIESSGPAAARKLLDARLPMVRELSLLRMNVQSQKQRMAALALLGDVDALRQEVGSHSGLLTATIQVDGLGLLGLALNKSDSRDTRDRLDALASKGEREGHLARMFAARLVRALSDVVASFDDGSVQPSRSLLDQGAMEGGMVEVVILWALRRSLQTQRKDSEAKAVEGRLRRLLPQTHWAILDRANASASK